MALKLLAGGMTGWVCQKEQIRLFPIGNQAICGLTTAASGLTSQQFEGVTAAHHPRCLCCPRMHKQESIISSFLLALMSTNLQKGSAKSKIYGPGCCCLLTPSRLLGLLMWVKQTAGAFVQGQIMLDLMKQSWLSLHSSQFIDLIYARWTIWYVELGPLALQGPLLL